MDTGQDTGTLRVTIREAAARLGVTDAAIRKRIQRGSLSKEMGSDGRVYVYLDPSQDMSQDSSEAKSQLHRDPLVEELRDRVAYLERSLQEEREARTEERRRHDTLMAQLMSRIPELPPAVSESASESPESVVEEPDRGEPRSSTPGPREGYERPRDTAEFPAGGSLTRPWWRRVFGG